MHLKCWRVRGIPTSILARDNFFAGLVAFSPEPFLAGVLDLVDNLCSEIFRCTNVDDSLFLEGISV